MKKDMFYVDYVVRCSPELKEFATYTEALEFALRVYMDAQHCQDNFVNRIFKGTILISE